MSQKACVIIPEKGEVSIDNKVVTLRPKTFELLLLLATKPNEIFSKNDIFQHVWPNSVVEDQVIFQSINEIRKELGDTDIIKTYPRRGYSWTITNTVIQSEQSRENSSTHERFSVYKIPMFAFIFVVLFTVVFSSYNSSNNRSLEPVPQTANVKSKQHRGLLILPFSVETLDESQKWIRFGAMQELINKLTPTINSTVFQLEDTIEILSRLSVDEKNKVAPIFDKSGASHILTASVSGLPGDYHIVYTLHEPQNTNTKTIHVKNISAGVNQLATVFNGYPDQTPSINESMLNEKFQDELVTKAIQLLEINDHQSAYAFLQTAVTNDPSSVFSHYMFAKVAMGLGHIDVALQSIEAALKVPNNALVTQYKNRLTYLKGGVLLSKRQNQLAEGLFKQAEQLSRDNKDWLYYSYSKSMLGKVKQMNGDYSSAKSYFSAAMQYQELLRCPMGVAQSHVDFAEFYLVQNDKVKTLQNYQAAETLIKEQKLSLAQPMLSLLKEKIDKLAW